jgi:UDP:flavonoid glycosyltransferase YjiC (YdhE family)
MKVLIVAAGSLGDTLPFVALGHALQARGHAVRLFANPHYASHAAGLPFAPIGTEHESDALLNDPRITHPRAGWQLLGEAFTRHLPAVHRALADEVLPQRTLAIGSSFAFSVRVLGNSHGVPTVTVHLAPAVFRSELRAPRLGPYGAMDRLPVPLQRALWWLMDRAVLDRLLARPLNAYRRSLGLPPVNRICGDWLNTADLTLGLFPTWFADPPADWPAHIGLTGFPYADGATHRPMPAPLQAFLDQGPPPIGFTAGTANAVSHDFFAVSAAACERLGCRGVLLTHDARQLPDRLPLGVLHVPYAPFGTLLPQLAAFVHHGGIGTTSQALRAGVPQLVRPMGYDQFDNAFHIQRLGAGHRLLPRTYRVANVTHALQALLNDATVRKRCRAIAVQAQEDGDAIGTAVEAILAMAARKGLDVAAHGLPKSS